MADYAVELNGRDGQRLRTMPHNLEAEMGLLGGIFIERGPGILNAIEYLKPEHFVDELHGKIYAAVLNLHGNGMPVDPVMLQNMIEEIGYLMTLAASAVTPINAREYAFIIFDLWRRRELIASCNEAADRAYGAEYELEVILEQHEAALAVAANVNIDNAETIRPRFELVPFDKIKLSTVGNYVVKRLVPAEGLTVVWGPPKCGKSFWSFDLGCRVALGWKYRGRRVSQGPVVYVALEGGAGFGVRAEAFRQSGKIAEDHESFPFFLITDRLDLIGEYETLIDRIREQLADERPVVVFIDTLNRSLAGSESSDEDMGGYIKAADMVRGSLECAVVIIHHCGIDATRPRGHTSLAGAVDAQIAVKRDPKSMTFSATVEFMKDGNEGDVIGNELEVIEIGIDDDGDKIKSCVVIEAEATAQTTTRLTPKQRRAIDALHNVLVDHGETSPGGKHYPPGVQVIPIDLWREHLFGAGILKQNASNPSRDFNRLKDQLADKGAIAEWDNRVWTVKGEPQ